MTTIILFFGALLDSFIGANLFVPGEPFLLAAGYQLYNGVLWGVIAVTLGGLLGDQASYFIGRKIGTSAQQRLVAWRPKTGRAVARFRLLMRTKGNYVLLFARLLGPVAWFVPFLAGSQRIAWRRFSTYATMGLLLGVGQWVLWGYFLAAGVQLFPWGAEVKLFLSEHHNSLLILLATTVMMIINRYWRVPYHKTVLALGLLSAFSWLNYSHFFENSDNFRQVEPPHYFQLDKVTFKVYPGQSAIYDAQGINVIFHGETPDMLMQQLGWIENKTFSRHDLELTDYLTLLQNKTPPVSDLFWQGQPQHLAYQKAGSLSKRIHIRWWFSGIDKTTEEKIWLGAISYDDGFAVTMHNGIPTILHSIDSNIDKQRDNLAMEILSLSNTWSAKTQVLSLPVIVDELNEYHSDGGILVVKKNPIKYRVLALNL